MFGAFSGAAAFFGEGPLLRLLRVVGASLARIAEAAISLFYVNVEGPMRKQGTATERAIAEAGLRSIQAIDALQAMINGLLRAHMEVAIERFRRLDLGRSVDTAHMTVGFVDLVGFTTLSGRLSASDLAGLIERFEERAFDVVTSRGGRLVKLIGDEVMFVTVKAAAACDTALALCEEFASDPAVTPRGALATGELVIRGGDYYGPIVNLASRLAELAVPRELLVTAAVADEARSDEFRFEPAGRRMLKGFEEPVALLTVERV
jgi:adenylate cyclase